MIAPAPSGRVRTVRGDVDPSDLGRVSAHEHIVMNGGLACIRDPEFRLDDLGKICADVRGFKAAGGGTIVDTMPLAEGRSARMLTAVAERTGVHVVASTGFHRLLYYTDRHWRHVYDGERIAALLIAEIETGMDERCFNGPDPDITSARAGLIKLAAEFHHIPAAAERTFRAAGLAHRATGAPVLVHTEQGTAAHQILDLLADCGVPPERVLLSHMDRNWDVTLHTEIAERGAMLGYDWLARIRRRPDSVITDLVLAMTERGYAGHLTLGMDLVRHGYWPAYGGGPGLRYLFGEFVPRLGRAGVPGDVLHTICVTNPARFLTFSSRKDTAGDG